MVVDIEEIKRVLGGEDIDFEDLLRWCKCDRCKCHKENLDVEVGVDCLMCYDCGLEECRYRRFYPDLGDYVCTRQVEIMIEKYEKDRKRIRELKEYLLRLGEQLKVKFKVFVMGCRVDIRCILKNDEEEIEFVFKPHRIRELRLVRILDGCSILYEEGKWSLISL
jgi:hypothetical protein